MGTDQNWYVTATHLLRATRGGAISWASAAGPLGLKDRGRGREGERAEEGGDRKGLALEQTPAPQRPVEAHSQPLLRAEDASLQGPKLGCQSWAWSYSDSRAILFVRLIEFTLSSWPGAPLLSIPSHLFWFTHSRFPPASHRHSRCLLWPRCLMALECCPATLRSGSVVTCCYIVTWPK